MKSLLAFAVGGVVSALVVGLVWLQVPLAAVAVVLVGAVCLAWLGLIVVLPWNLVFEARRTLRELARAKSRGLVVDAAHEARAQTIERRMFKASIGLHLASAVLLVLGSWWADVPQGNAFAALFLLSTFFRPAVEYYRSLRGLLSELVAETNFPHADVRSLQADVQAHETVLKGHAESHHELERRLTDTELRLDARLADANRRLELIARRFDETVGQLTDNKELIAGLRAFLRLVRQPEAKELGLLR